MFLPWSPLGGSSRVRGLGDFPAISKLAKAKGVSVYSIVLAWLRAKSPRIVPIPGATKITSIEDSVGSLEVTLSEEEVQQLDQGA